MEKKKKILIVCRSFFPQISPRSFRATELAKEFARKGHDVKVYLPTCDRDYSSFEKENNLRIENLGVLRWREIEPRGGKLRKGLLRMLRRGLLLFFEWPDLELMFKVSKALKDEEGYDLLVSIAIPFPIHWGVARVTTKSHRIADTWVADCGDPYMFGRLDSFRKPFYFKYLERSFCAKCTFISVPFEAMRRQFYSDFREKIVVIPQGFDFSVIRRVNGPVQNERLTMAFAGSIIPGFRDLKLFIEYISGFRNNFLLIVYTRQTEWFEKFKNRLGDRIEIHPYIDRLSLIYELSKVDFLINVDTTLDSQDHIEAVPSKLIDYALCDRPILNISSDYLDTGKIDSFMERNYSQARIIDIDQYDIRLVADKFLELCN